MTRNLGIDGYLVLSILASSPNREWYGHELAKGLETNHGLVSRLLERLLDRGWVVDRWEDSTAAAAGRQPRHYYQLKASALPEVERLLKETGRRVAPLMRWASSSAAPNAPAAPPGPSELSTEEITATIASFVAELRRRAGRAAHDGPEKHPLRRSKRHDDGIAGPVPEPRTG